MVKDTDNVILIHCPRDKKLDGGAIGYARLLFQITELVKSKLFDLIHVFTNDQLCFKLLKDNQFIDIKNTEIEYCTDNIDINKKMISKLSESALLKSNFFVCKNDSVIFNANYFKQVYNDIISGKKKNGLFSYTESNGEYLEYECGNDYNNNQLCISLGDFICISYNKSKRQSLITRIASKDQMGVVNALEYLHTEVSLNLESRSTSADCLMSNEELLCLKYNLSNSNAVYYTFDFSMYNKMGTVSDIIAARVGSGGKVLLFGNGGSAADSQHIAAEFISKLARDRQPLPALALTTDTSILTAIGNDYGFEKVFERQVNALASANDIAIGISTSGTSPNVLAGLRAARTRGIPTVLMTGSRKHGYKYVDFELNAASSATASIQEIHIQIAHILCALAERDFIE